MNRLISDISNFSRTISEIESGRFELLNINKFLKNFQQNYINNKKNISLTISISNDNLKILVNKDKLYQVFFNLIDNSISMSDHNSKIFIKSKKSQNNNVIFKIYDQGKGINLKDKEKIFNRFYTDREQNRNNHSGLGLSISREIIKSFNGTIELTKSDNLDYKGACFLIKLPLKV